MMGRGPQSGECLKTLACTTARWRSYTPDCVRFQFLINLRNTRHEQDESKKIVLTIRLIRSLAHRNIRLLVLRQVPQDITVSALFDLIFATISLDPKFKIFAAMKPKADTLNLPAAVPQDAEPRHQHLR
ncbi:Uncharacterized protein family UPF0538 [Carpediemonas membranifera]|uniref:Uncharacterized protein family UPF0538 n=1 Tax=Carpediemonas membranifera TaxID=201153 RepID=A0A8J6E3P8_9EUKA|nr:Uncharacterized protein family UPF0538 [Carpediemonas membranifera]|eukprot:KAG9396218.1 Uncharacterized protein family UPF0538 [Carpediemonas membranifera]